MKYCLTFLILFLMFFSMATVTADENATSDEISDLSISAEVFNQKKEYNAGDEVYLMITAKVSNGTAKNVKVHESLENMEYVHHMTDTGEFNPVTGIWDIGDLNSSQDAKLAIVNKIKSYGKFSMIFYTSSDSNDSDLSNNGLVLSGATGSDFVSNVTSKSDDADKLRHNSHYASTYSKETSKKVLLKGDDFKNTNPVPVKPAILSKTSRNSFDFIKSMMMNVVNQNKYTSLPLSVFILFLISLTAIVIGGKIS